ncbi:hypothetical protein PR003_g4120 [Phytophthora rubi]|uniref:ARS-binding protein 1 N-terminal domain-containing protein n=1 Tax=Phytophthora rubi TaxID=129364 RepID=A0A6A3P3L3_9STRA|nr:hypothetical protein PR001_g2730 [Phytophthora rubi]KAE9352957.1 hypothetical protein PR003_g4120 [Phytophthora rubi]
MTQEKLAEWAQATFSLANTPARNTISDILRKAHLLAGEPYQDGKRRKPLGIVSAAAGEEAFGMDPRARGAECLSVARIDRDEGPRASRRALRRMRTIVL